MTARRLLAALAVALLILGGLVVGCSSLPFLGRAAPTVWAHDRTEVLPQPTGLRGVSLAEALERRRSTRGFTTDELTPEQSATLLWAAQGQTTEWGGRTAPSAGALYPLDVYLVTAQGTAHYVPDGHQVQVQESAQALGLVADAVGQEAAADAPALLVVTGTPDRLRPKYLLHADRYTLLEAGHVAQNVLLAATALELGGVPIGAFDEGRVAAALGLPRGEQAIYVIPIGVPSTSR